MNLIGYLLLWLKAGERPPREVLLIGTRKPTQSEIEYGKMLENEAGEALGLGDTSRTPYEINFDELTHEALCHIDYQIQDLQLAYTRDLEDIRRQGAFKVANLEALRQGALATATEEAESDD